MDQDFNRMAIMACLVESAREAMCMQLQMFIAPEGGMRQIIRLSIVPDRAEQPAVPKVAGLNNAALFFERLGHAMNDVANSKGRRMRQIVAEVAGGMLTVRVRVIIAPEQMEFVNPHVDQGGGAAAARAMFTGKPMPPKPEPMNKPTLAPTIEGRLARAWAIKPPPEVHPEMSANLGSYLVEAPFAHPMWSYYIIAACHLRHIEGAPEARKDAPDREYEFMIASFDPTKPLPDVDGSGKHAGALMRPADFRHQVAGGVSDDEIRLVLEDVVRTVTLGVLSPDSDYRELWKQVLDAAVAHHRSGVNEVN